MKMVCAVFVVLCLAGAVRSQAAGEICGAGNVCDTNLECQDSQCRIKIDDACINGYDKCVITAPPCGSSSTCECPTDATASSDKTSCSCTEVTQVISMDRAKCVSKAGESCDAPEKCIANSDCTNCICVCKDGYVANAEKDKCSLA